MRSPSKVHLTLLLCYAMLSAADSRAAASFPEFVDPNPAAGNSFGFAIVVLSTGNVVVASPGDDAVASNAGAVYLFNGSTGALISTLRGSATDDQIGSGGITALSNGNYVIASPLWSGGTSDAGAVTWGSGTSGVSGVISAANSLVGSTANDQVGAFGVTALANGNYVVRNPSWDRGGVVNAGAVTWGNGTTGITGAVSSANSLVGAVQSDLVGTAVFALANGNYVVFSPNWDGPGTANVGAATWGNGATGVTGAVSSSSSLIGSVANDQVGSSGATELANGNYVVCSPFRDNGAAINAGAATWGSGTAGITGVVSAANSLVGSQTNDQVSLGGVTALANGNYVVVSHLWHNVNVLDAGAVTWGNGTTGIVGTVSGANSLIGGATSDQVGGGGVTALTNGHYVVRSPICNVGGFVDAGAVTWANGATGRTGVVSAVNSLVGSATNDQVGSGGAIALANGHYVVRSPLCNVGAVVDAGAVTWGDGAGGATGVVSAANSLVGSVSSDRVGNVGVIALSNGNYVVASSLWDNGVAVDAGAATWGSGASGVSGTISSGNSLVGSTTDDHVSATVTALSNGHYVISSPDWDNTFEVDAGAATWGSGTLGVNGVLSAANSLVGSQGDQVGSGVTPLVNGNYVVASTSWNNGGQTSAGAATWGDGAVGTSGQVSAINSLVGSRIGDQVGTNVLALSDGNFVVTSAAWDNGNFLLNAGAATWGDGTAGANGVVSASNSLVSLSSNTTLFPAIEDAVNGTFLSRFADEGGGRIRVGPVAPFVITSAQDIPADQGGWLRLTFHRFNLDYDGATPAVTTYGVWRHVPGTLPSSAVHQVSAGLAPAPDAAALERMGSVLPPTFESSLVDGRLVSTIPVPPAGESAATLPPGTWELVTSVPALQQEQYVVAVPTISNAAANDYVVTGHTQMPSVWVITPPISGQSIDNLAPTQPMQLAANYTNGQTDLQWAANSEPDIGSYSLHRGSSAGFTPTLGNRITSQIGTTYSDVGPAGSYYKLCAVDVNGNQSSFALITPGMTTDVEGEPVAFAFHGVRPNPANARGLHVSFALPSADAARLELLDVSGRVVITRDVGALGAGRHVMNLAEGQTVRAGIYWVRLSQGDKRATRRAVVVE